MTQAQQPEALRIADNLNENADLDAAEGGNPAVCKLERDAAVLLQTQHYRILELEGSVTHLDNVYSAAMRKVVELEQGKCLHQIAEPATTESVLIDGTAYVVHAEVAAELLRLHIELQTAPQAVQPAVPVLFVSREQLESHTDHLASKAGRYLPARKTAVGKFTTPLYAHPAEGVPAQPINERVAFDDFFRQRNGLHPDTDTTFRSDAAEPWKYWKARAALAATQPAAQGLDPDSVVRHLAIGRAIERVCVELPEGAEISISLEKGAGTITLIDWDGNEQENFPTDDGFAGTLNAAVDTAIADEAALAAQAKQGGAA